MSRKKTVIVCLWLLFCGSAVGQMDSSKYTDYWEGVIWGIDTAIKAIEEMDTKEGMIRELWIIRKQSADAVREFEADIKQANKKREERIKASEEYQKRMIERIEAADSVEEIDKLQEENEAEMRRLNEEIEKLEEKMK